MSRKANRAAKTGLGLGLRVCRRALLWLGAPLLGAPLLGATLVVCGLYPQVAQAWYVSIDGSIAPLSTPLAGRIRANAGGARGHFHFDGSLSFIPAEQFTLYRGSNGVTERMVDYPTFVGVEARYYVRSRKPFTKRHDVYVGLGADFPILAQSFVPGVKVGGGYSLRLHRRVFLETGLEYYFYGALTNELFVGLGFKTLF